MASHFSHFYHSIARSLGKKISLQYQNDDVIDFGDLDLNDDQSEEKEPVPSERPLSVSNGVSSTASRRESRGVSEVSVVLSCPLQNLLTASYNFSVQRCNFLVQEPVLIKY